MGDPPAGYGGVGWSGGNFHDYDHEYGVDLVQLAAFLRGTQPEAAEALALSEDGLTRRAFLTRLQGEIAKRGTIEVLRNGIKRGALHLDLFYGMPSAHNAQARERFERNRFTVTRQLRYSRDEAQRALDIGLFINGLPVFTFELKNSLTKQTVDDAVLQYQQDRNRGRSCSSSGAASRTSPWTSGRCSSARGSPARRRGSCRSTGAGTTARATRPTRTGWRSTVRKFSVHSVLWQQSTVPCDRGQATRLR